jgi:AraC-like DNA-binding protein
MPVVLDTAKVPAARRGDVLRESLAAAAAPMNVQFQCAPEKVSYRVEFWQLGRARLVCSSGFGGMRLTRTPRLVRQYGPELVAVGFQLRGSGFHAQNGHTQDKAPGGLSVLDFTLPFECGLSESAVAGNLIIPADDLGLPPDVIQHAQQALASSPVYDLMRGHITRLVRDADKITEPRAAAMTGRAVIELTRALLVSARHDDRGGHDLWNQTLETQLATYVEQHLTDPDLCAEQLARVHHISKRQVYKLWSGRETSLAQWIIQQRLEGARAELGAARHSPLTIAAVADKWGFTDTTFFSRRFREAYGMSPREWRQIHASMRASRHPGND